ncbi:MAG: PHD finger domain-containing protein [Candidatus Hodarchaeales archaeon]
MDQWYPVNLTSLIKVKDAIWDFFRCDLNIKPITFKAMVCYSYIISNRGIFAADIANISGLSIKNANKLLNHLTASNLLVSHELSEEEPGQHVFINEFPVFPSLKIKISWEEIVILAILKMLPELDFDILDRLLSLLKLKILSPRELIGSLLDKKAIQGKFTTNEKKFIVSGYSYFQLFKQRFFSEHFQIIEGIANLYGPVTDLLALKQILRLDYVEIFGILSEIVLVDFMKISIVTVSLDTVFFRFDTSYTRQESRRFPVLDEDGIYFTILNDLILAGKRSFKELSKSVGVKPDEIGSLLLLLSTVMNTDNIIVTGSKNDPIVEFKFNATITLDQLPALTYEEISCLLVLLKMDKAELFAGNFPIRPEKKLRKILTKLSLAIQVPIRYSNGKISIKDTKILEEWFYRIITPHVSRGYEKIKARSTKEVDLSYYDDVMLELAKNSSHRYSFVQEENDDDHVRTQGCNEETRGLTISTRNCFRITDLDKVLLGILKWTRIFEAERIAPLLFLDSHVLTKIFLSLCARDMFKVHVRRNGSIAITNPISSTYRSANITKDNLALLSELNTLVSSGRPLIVSESDILSGKYSLWDLGFLYYYDLIDGSYSRDNLCFTIRKVNLVTNLTTLSCLNCGVSVSALSSFCDKCGCVVVRCLVCGRHIQFGEVILLCSNCDTIFHAGHLKEYIKQYGCCPKCGQNSPEISPFLM